MTTPHRTKRRPPNYIKVGMRFGRLLITAISPRLNHQGSPYWFVRCECGIEKEVAGDNMLAGTTVSCGCYSREAVANAVRTHGECSAGGKTREYNTWSKIKSRCCDPNNTAYRHYGGRGINVCDRWKESFAAFLEDMGRAPEGCSIDRIDNDGDYEPGNCRWADRTQQMRNTRGNHVVEYQGERMTLVELSERTGLSYMMLLKRLMRGWTVEDAVRKPRVEKRPCRKT